MPLRDFADVLELVSPEEAEQELEGEPRLLLMRIGIPMEARFFEESLEEGIEAVFKQRHQLLGCARRMAFFKSEISTRV